MSNRWKRYLVPWLGCAVALGLHGWRLDQPAQLVSDEVFFVNDGWSYVIGQPYFDPHPPLGKEQLGAVFRLFGYAPVTWRILNAIGGALIVPLLWWLVWRLSKKRAAANLTVLFVLLDGLLLTESRLGLINVPYVLYGLVAVAATLKALEARRPAGWLLASGLMIGAAVSVKWLALSIVVPAVILWFWPGLFGQAKNPDQLRSTWWWAAGGLLVIPALVYWVTFRLHFGWLGVPETFIQTNLQMLNYNLRVPSVGDPFAQPWWGWLLAWQPFPYWSQGSGDQVSVIRSLPNPWLWWTGAIGFGYSLWRGWRVPALRCLNIFLLMTWLPFGLIQRVMYSYHALPFGLFLAMLLGVLAGQGWARSKKMVIGYVGLAILTFIFFSPWYLNQPLSSAEHRWRAWLPGWQVTTTLPASSTSQPASPPIESGR